MREELDKNNIEQHDTAESKLQKLSDEETEKISGGEKTGEYTCRTCGKTFTDIRALMEHQKETGHMGII